MLSTVTRPRSFFKGKNTLTPGGEDVILYDSTGLKDRNLTGEQNAPNVDASQDWTESSNTVTSGVRTIVATRALDTTPPPHQRVRGCLVSYDLQFPMLHLRLVMDLVLHWLQFFPSSFL